MKARKVYEFKRGQDVKASLGVGKKIQIEKWFETFAPNVEYIIKTDLSVRVGGDLDLSDTSITHLPDGLHVVGGDLDLNDTSITHLPDRLYVGGSLDLQGTPIKHLPDRLYVGRILYLENSGLQYMSDEEIRSRAEIKGGIKR